MSDDHIHESGAKRSDVMPYYSAIPFGSMRRLALRATGAPRGETLVDRETGFTQEGGSDKYGYGNWRRGLPMEDTFNHVIEHLYRWKGMIEAGVTPHSDELAGAAWGIMLPLMAFETAYVQQYDLRNKIMREFPASPVDWIEQRLLQNLQGNPILIKSLVPKAPKTAVKG